MFARETEITDCQTLVYSELCAEEIQDRWLDAAEGREEPRDWPRCAGQARGRAGMYIAFTTFSPLTLFSPYVNGIRHIGQSFSVNSFCSIPPTAMCVLHYVTASAATALNHLHQTARKRTKLGTGPQNGKLRRRKN